MMSPVVPPIPDWSLHPQLERDTTPVGDLPVSRVLIMNDANYPWLLLVPRRRDVSEILDLDAIEHAQLMTELVGVGHALKTVTQCDKLNIAAIGNLVPQLHIHVIARGRSDPSWPRPVWGAIPPAAYATDERERLIAALREKIWPG
jgi:diadenosine tetraphosphate (Ap4A) HIT family hydrolase